MIIATLVNKIVQKLTTFELYNIFPWKVTWGNECDMAFILHYTYQVDKKNLSYLIFK